MRTLVVVANALQLSYLGAYGNDWIDTPALDRLAAEGIVFDQHIADSPSYAGARRSWFTGRCAFPTPNDPSSTLPESVDLFHLLRAQGVTTQFLACAALAESLDDLADVPQWVLWVELNSLLPPWRFPEELYQSPEAEEPLPPLTNPPCGPLGDDPDDLRFLHLQESYGAAVRHLDATIEELLEVLEERDLLETVNLIVTTDRGFALGEHGIVGEYRPWLHEELVHLPLIVRLAGAEEAGRRVPLLTQPVDLMPTLLDLHGLPPALNIHGHSLLPLLRGEEKPLREYACSGLQFGGATHWALRTPEWAFLYPVQEQAGDAPRQPQLFVKPDDRWEVNDVIQHHLELGEAFQQTLREFVTVSRRLGLLQPPPLQR